MKRSAAPTTAAPKDDQGFEKWRPSVPSGSSMQPTYSSLSSPDTKRPKLKSYQSDILDSQWEAMYTSLLEYKARTGNCLVPHRFGENPALGAWVSTQRRQYKVYMEGRAWTGKANSTPIDPYRVRRLNEIDFAWTTDNPIKIPWKRRFQELQEYKKEHGHCLVPSVYEKNVKLGHWVSTQRHQAKALKQGRPSRMTDEHIKALDAIEFAWIPPKGASRIHLKDNIQDHDNKDDLTDNGGNDGKKLSRLHAPITGTKLKDLTSASPVTTLSSSANAAGVTGAAAKFRTEILPVDQEMIAPIAALIGTRSLYNDTHNLSMDLQSSLLALSLRMRLENPQSMGLLDPLSGLGLFRDSHPLFPGGLEPWYLSHRFLLDQALVSGAYNDLCGTFPRVDVSLAQIRMSQLLEPADRTVYAPASYSNGFDFVADNPVSRRN